jgi:hypothetical protein
MPSYSRSPQWRSALRVKAGVSSPWLSFSDTRCTQSASPPRDPASSWNWSGLRRWKTLAAPTWSRMAEQSLRPAPAPNPRPARFPRPRCLTCRPFSSDTRICFINLGEWTSAQSRRTPLVRCNTLTSLISSCFILCECQMARGCVHVQYLSETDQRNRFIGGEFPEWWQAELICHHQTKIAGLKPRENGEWEEQ